MGAPVVVNNAAVVPPKKPEKSTCHQKVRSPSCTHRLTPELYTIMTPIKSNRAPLTKRISALAVTAAAALTLAAFSPNAHAQTPKPTKEFVALADS